jgi:hypothetical protein
MAHLAAITGLDADTLELVEPGLAGDDRDADWVAAVVEVALGRRQAHAQLIAGKAVSVPAPLSVGCIFS